MNINGSRVDIFVEEVFKELCETIKRQNQFITITDQSISSCINSMKNNLTAKSNVYTQQQITAKSMHTDDPTQKVLDIQSSINIHSIQPAVDSSTTSCSSRDKPDHQQTCNESKNNNKYSSDTETCPICLSFVDSGVACDKCDFWFHFHCTGSTQTQVDSDFKENQYVCMLCTDDLLYEDRNLSLADINVELEVPEQITIDCQENTIPKELYVNTKDHVLIRSPQNSSPPNMDNSASLSLAKSNLENSTPLTTLQLNVDNSATLLHSVQPNLENSALKLKPPLSSPDIITLSSNSAQLKSSTSANSQKLIQSNLENQQRAVEKEIPTVEENRQPLPKKIGKSKSKYEKDDIIMTQKTRILNLENELNQLKNVVKTFTDNQNTNVASNNSNPDFTPQHNTNYDRNRCCYQRVQEELTVQRIRSLEQQVVQNMCINTALLTQMAIQAQPRYYHSYPHLSGYPYQWAIPPNMPHQPVLLSNMNYQQQNPYMYTHVPHHHVLQPSFTTGMNMASQTNRYQPVYPQNIAPPNRTQHGYQQNVMPPATETHNQPSYVTGMNMANQTNRYQPAYPQNIVPPNRTQYGYQQNVMPPATEALNQHQNIPPPTMVPPIIQQMRARNHYHLKEIH